MDYEFEKATWIEETPTGDTSHESIDKMHQDIEDKIRESIEKLIESRENFLGEGKTAEVHFLDADSKLCYKIIRKTDVMARPDAVENLPPKYRELYEEKKAKEEKSKRDPFYSKVRESDETWHVDLFTEASYLSRARKIDPEGPVKIPRPDAHLEIHGKEEGNGYEISDELKVLLMETMDAISVDDLIRKRELPPQNFDYDRFCKQVQNFMDMMHANKLYHRDLHAGNIMIDRTTGNPVFIDFGRSCVSTEEEAYLEEPKPGIKMHFIRDEQMFRDKVKTPLGQYLAYRKLTETKK